MEHEKESRKWTTIEYRGISAELAVGSTLTVEFCQAGVLRLRRAPAKVADKPKVATKTESKGNARGS
jgi:hypothetical protein